MPARVLDLPGDEKVYQNKMRLIYLCTNWLRESRPGACSCSLRVTTSSKCRESQPVCSALVQRVLMRLLEVRSRLGLLPLFTMCRRRSWPPPNNGCPKMKRARLDRVRFDNGVSHHVSRLHFSYDDVYFPGTSSRESTVQHGDGWRHAASFSHCSACMMALFVPQGCSVFVHPHELRSKCFRLMFFSFCGTGIIWRFPWRFIHKVCTWRVAGLPSFDPPPWVKTSKLHLPRARICVYTKSKYARWSAWGTNFTVVQRVLFGCSESVPDSSFVSHLGIDSIIQSFE